MPQMPSHEVEDLPGLDDLADAILSLKTVEEVKRFLRDLCTMSETEALVHRWQIAKRLDEKRPYIEVAETIKTSTATVTRVAQWLRHGTGGYRIALDRTKKKAKAK